MVTVEGVQVVVGASLTDFQKKMGQIHQSLKGVSDSMKRIGKTMSLAVTAPILAMGVKSAMAFDKQAKAIAAVESRLKSTGGAAGFTSEALQEMARNLQEVSLFGDEEILKGVTQQLLTFPQVAGEAFKRAQLAAIDLSATLGQDLQSSTIMLGKALQDPVLGLTAMRRVGISFSESQQTVIKSLAETGRLAEAQGLILDELSRQYGGAAEAAAQAGLGPFQQLSNTIGDLTEDFGKIIVEGLAPFIKTVKEIVLWLKGLDGGTKKTIVVVAALVAGIGPLLLLMGGLLSALPMIAAGFAFLTGPIGLTIAAIAAVGVAVYSLSKQYEDFGDFSKKIWGDIALTQLQSIAKMLEGYRKWIQWLGPIAKPTSELLKQSLIGIKELSLGLEGMGAKPVKLFSFVGDSLDAAKEAFGKITGGLDALDTSMGDVATGSGKDLEDRLARIQKLASKRAEPIGLNLGGIAEEVTTLNVSTGKFEKSWQKVKSAIDATGVTLRTTFAPVITEVIETANVSLAEMGAILRFNMEEIGINAIDGLANAIGGAAAGFASFGKAIKRIMKGVIADIVATIAKVLILKALMSIFGGGTGIISSIVKSVAGAGGVTTGFASMAMPSASVGPRLGNQAITLQLQGEFVQRGGDLIAVIDQRQSFLLK